MFTARNKGVDLMPRLRKIQVAKGIFWVEVPEAQLYVLCGCPADSVKHLMKRGLIVTQEKGGVTFETGPNAILLSDVLVQNGSFANLAEFPVLQMLYRQGMILPNHPNNTGLKPLLIGSEDQVKAQMQCIYRGNYGLVSEEEMIDGGVSSATAHEMMRMKLKFAFGEIRQTEGLLDTRIVGGEPVEIRNGVFVRRFRLNVFEFQYQGEFVTVDLNLAPLENYEVPYLLGFHNINREYFAVIHSGEGDGWDINRPCMSSILMFQGKIYLIDAGPNISNNLMSLGISVNEIEGIFHTHAHDDHFVDLTTLMRADHRIKYYTTPLVRASVTKKLAALMSIEEKDFSDFFEVHDLEFDVWNNIDSLEVKPIFSPHPVETNIFVFRALWEDGYKSYAHFADIVSLDVLEGMITEDPLEIGISRAFVEQVKKDYLTTAHVKKIDIGGGLIHGKAEDFREDPSEKIILSHTALALTDQQKEIGSGAPFGMVDVLIPTHQNYPWLYAFDFLQSYFPKVPLHQLRTLLNNPVITFNPESIILKTGAVNEEIYLILTGNVEMIQSQYDMHNILCAGAFIGEISGLMGTPLMETYRSANFVQALRLPSNLYLEFIRHNELYEDIMNLQEKRHLLQTTWLFGEAISFPEQNRIAQAMQCHFYPTGERLSNEKHSELCIVKSGRLQICIDGDVLENLNVGDFFGEEDILLRTSSLFEVCTIEPTEVFHIPGEVLLDIPIVRWKLFETLKKRMRLLLNPELSNMPVFYWRENYSVHIQEMDDHHRRLFERANKLYEEIDADKEQSSLEDALDFLIRYTEFHFTEEEVLLKRHNYSEYETQRGEHKRIIKEVLELKERFKRNEVEMNTDVLDFLKDLIINHILTEDRKYSEFFLRMRESQ